MLERLVPSLELNLEGFREILSKVVRRAGLQRAPVAHQRLDRIRAGGAGELLALTLGAVNNGHRELRLAELLVEREDLQGLRLRLLRRLVGGVAFLPEKFRRAEEWARDFLPPDDVGPLVDEHGKIARSEERRVGKG